MDPIRASCISQANQKVLFWRCHVLENGRACSPRRSLCCSSIRQKSLAPRRDGSLPPRSDEWLCTGQPQALQISCHHKGVTKSSCPTHAILGILPHPSGHSLDSKYGFAKQTVAQIGWDGALISKCCTSNGRRFTHDAKPSLSHKSSHQAGVTKSPNHMCETSCATNDASACHVTRMDFFAEKNFSGSMLFLYATEQPCVCKRAVLKRYRLTSLTIKEVSVLWCCIIAAGSLHTLEGCWATENTPTIKTKDSVSPRCNPLSFLQGCSLIYQASICESDDPPVLLGSQVRKKTN